MIPFTQWARVVTADVRMVIADRRTGRSVHRIGIHGRVTPSPTFRNDPVHPVNPVENRPEAVGERRLAIAANGAHSACRRMKRTSRQPAKRVELGKHIVADPEICGGQPTFKGTRIMVWIVLEQLEEGLTWPEIVREWDGKVKEGAIAEAISIADLVVKHEPFRGFNVGARRKSPRRATAIAA